jgi:nucleoside-diphosphate-sugar epimerase
MRALVTGGTGFLGKALIRKLLERQFEVHCLARRSSDTREIQAIAEGKKGRLVILAGSLERPESYASTLQQCDVVYHLAAQMKGNSATLFSTNVTGTRQLLSAASRIRLERFVLVSSLGVYGTHHLRWGDYLDEMCPVDAQPHRRDPYTFSKIAEESCGWQFYQHSKLPLVVIRPGVIYGPGRDCLSTRVGLRFGQVLIRMGGCQPLPYTFVDNCAEAVLLAGVAAGAPGQAFNIVDDDLLAARDLVTLYRKMVGCLRVVPIPHWAIRPLSRFCEWYNVRSRGQIPAVLTPYKSVEHWKPLRYDNSRAKTVLGWQPRVSFVEGVQQTLAWLRENPAAS